MGNRHEFSKINNELFIFDSVSDIEEYVDSSKWNKFDHGASWVGMEFKSYEDLQIQLKSLWEHGVDTMEAMVERLKDQPIPELKQRARKTTWDTEGDEIDWEKMMNGESDFWKKTETENREGNPEVSVVIDTTTPWMYDAEDILWRGAAAIALAHLLEDKGYRCEIWVANGSTLFEGKNHGVITACCLKRTSDAMDMSTLINTVSGWFYRSETFLLLHSIAAKNGERARHTLGMAYEPRPADLDCITLDDNRIYSSGVFSFDGACQQIVAELQRIAGDEE